MPQEIVSISNFVSLSNFYVNKSEKVRETLHEKKKQSNFFETRHWRLEELFDKVYGKIH